MGADFTQAFALMAVAAMVVAGVIYLLVANVSLESILGFEGGGSVPMLSHFKSLNIN
jgi:hypothetical protein